MADKVKELQAQVQMAPVNVDERAVLGEEVAEQMLALTLAPVDLAFAEVMDGGGTRCFAVQMLVVFPPDIIRLPRIVTMGPNNQPVLDERLAKAFAAAAVRFVMREDVLTPEARAHITAQKLAVNLGRGPSN